MTKEEFKERDDLIFQHISKLKKEQKELRDSYTNEHSVYERGDKVKITKRDGSECMAFVWDSYEGSGDIKYVFGKVKKDGTPSSRKLWIWYSDEPLKIELIEKYKEPESFKTS